jgi:lysophospholipase L1-like esterase
MIGDSITQDGSWHNLLGRDDILNRGVAGDTSRGLLRRVDRLEPGIEKAFIMIGINDLIWNETPEAIFQNYIQIVAKLKAKGIIPIVQSTLYTGKESAKRYNGYVAVLNDALQEYCEEENIDFIDLNETLSPFGYLDDRFTMDGIHLQDQAYMYWVEKIKHYL